jgi:multidrug efflux pump subunit AcrB
VILPVQQGHSSSWRCCPTLGLIALSGIIINNAIVLIDQIDIERATPPLNAAIAEAARKRFRPILLTSLTTVLGLLPMALSGGALWEPMATLMIGGLGVSSIMTLVYVPALYRVLFRDSQKLSTFHPSAPQAA